MPSSDDLLAGGPPADDAPEDLPRFIGVPKGYTAQRPLPERFSGGLADTGNILRGGSGRTDAMVARTPLYREGAEYVPSTLAVEDRARLQLAMRQAGLFTKKERFTVGVWDDNTRNAYRRLLEYANGAGLTWQDALTEYAAAKAAGGGDLDEESQRAPLVVKISNPADIRRGFDATLPGIIGRKLRPEELERFTRAYQAVEEAEQRQVYSMSETGGTVVEGPSLAGFMADQAQAIDPAGKAEMDVLGTANNPFFDLLRVSGG